jgi:hypothetical protein
LLQLKETLKLLEQLNAHEAPELFTCSRTAAVALVRFCGKRAQREAQNVADEALTE